MSLEWKIASFVQPGSHGCGDLAIVKSAGSRSLIAVVDGIGHGDHAEHAAHIACHTIAQHADRPVNEITRHCHTKLAATRGVVMSIAEIDFASGWMSWMGIGNVQGLLCHALPHAIPRREELLLHSGIVGAHLPRARASRVQIQPRDLLVFGTDGLRPGFTDEVVATRDPEQLASALLNGHCRGTDDALVLVARLQ